MKFIVLFGSQSYEHEISIVSAISMKKVIKEELLYIFIDKNRKLYHIPNNLMKSNLFSSEDYKKCDVVSICDGGFMKKKLFSTQILEFDVILNLVHGGDGEDGTLASMFKFFNIPFIGPRNLASVVSSNKFITKNYADSYNVKTLDCKYFTKKDNIEIEKYPIIIKPTNLGSSIGVSIVKNKEELEYALDIAFEFDDSIIIEPFIKDVKEYNLAGTKINNEFKFSIVEEPQKEEFLDFDKKYLDFTRTSKTTSANINQETIEKLQDNFKRIYNNTFEGSLIRCDFFIIEDEIYLNEINSIPGSMANYLFDDFNDIIIDLANNLPINKYIQINYDYVNKIQNAKGKA